jgi:hypothetical protein
MTNFPAAVKGHRELISFISLADFEPSWGGSSFRGDGFCFGSEDGRILLTDVDGIPKGPPETLSRLGEAINGLAFIAPRWLSFSTRDELVILTLSQPIFAATIPGGAHGVIASASGYFLAPLGTSGLMVCRPTGDSHQEINISTGSAENINIYQVITFPVGAGREIVACAARTTGVAATCFMDGSGNDGMSILTLNGLDVVDLCSVKPCDPAIAAVATDRTLILFRDAVRDRAPFTVRYACFKGVAYRLLCCRGYLFLLTSEALYVIADLVKLFLSGLKGEPITPVLEVPVEAIDANTCGDDWVIIVTPDGALRFDVGLLDAYLASSQGRGPSTELLQRNGNGHLPAFQQAVPIKTNVGLNPREVQMATAPVSVPA